MHNNNRTPSGMNKALSRVIAFSTALLFTAVATLPANASNMDAVETTTGNAPLISESSQAVADESNSLFPQLDRPLYLSHFTWGVDLGSSIDIGSNDLSTFNIDAYFGYKSAFWRTLAVGAGIHKAFGNEYTFVPVYVLMRTSFRTKPSMFFAELKTGYSFNTLADSGSKGGVYLSIGGGINLAMSQKVQSHIVLSYGYYGFKNAEHVGVSYNGNNINYANLTFGLNF